MTSNDELIKRIRDINIGLRSTAHGSTFLATAARREGFVIDDEGTAVIKLAEAGWTWDEICFING